MKKYFIIAVAALVASAACTKNITETPESAISFEVVKYTPQTKAYNSLLDEYAAGSAIQSFTTNAWFHGSGTYGTQQFMNDQAIVPDNTTDPTKWAASGRLYFWPKTGYINFFSYAGSPVPTAKAEGSITYNAVTVNTNSNILVADAAYHYNQNTTNDASIYQQNSVEKGVPTLFRHKLAKVKFDVIFDASEANDDKYAWTATITAASVTVPQQGSLTVSFAEPAGTSAATVAGTGAWSSLGSYNAVDKVSGNIVLTAKGGNKSDGSTTDGTAAGTAVELIAESAVIPHTLTDNVVFNMSYTLSYSYNGGTAISEDVVIDATKLTVFTPSVAAWAMNTIYTYHIIIKPNGTILFDPAVETWVPESDEPSYTYGG
ncbi:MAG: fimbrillin family protein [Bacteroidales bacterium]|nr:fimbrillin family protein [Bacteroidales bacterium]